MLNGSVILWRCESAYGDAASTHGEVKNAILVLSVLFDLIPCLFCSLFASHVYRGVDVSHPVYAVVFSNIILSLLLSVFAFVVKIINNQIISCIGGFLALINQSSLVYMNGICWSVVAILRYYLLIQVKSQNDENGQHMDMMKLKWIALMFYWGFTLVHCALRCCFVLAQNLYWMPNIARIPWGLLLYIANPITTCAVYYRLDIALKMRNTNTDSMNRNKEVPIEIIHDANCDTLDTFEPLGSAGTNNIYSGNTGKDNASRSRLSMAKSLCTDYNNELPYGGIYVGATEDTRFEYGNNMIGLEKTHSLKKGEVKMAKDKHINHNRDDVNHDKDISIARLITNDAGTSFSTTRCTKEITKSSDLAASYLYSDFILPNEVMTNDQKAHKPIHDKIDNDYEPDIVIQLKKRNKTVANNYMKYPKVRNTQRVVTEASTRNKRSGDIFVVERYFEEMENFDNSEEGDNINNQLPQQDPDLETDEYKCSKEHKSILKALLVNFIIHGVIVIIFVISKIKSGEKTDGYVLIVLAIMFSLYRSFVPVLSAIFCFEVVYLNFLQFLDALQDRLRALFERMRNLIYA